jgi:hypothetical protein
MTISKLAESLLSLLYIIHFEVRTRTLAFNTSALQIAMSDQASQTLVVFLRGNVRKRKLPSQSGRISIVAGFRSPCTMQEEELHSLLLQTIAWSVLVISSHYVNSSFFLKNRWKLESKSPHF